MSTEKNKLILSFMGLKPVQLGKGSYAMAIQPWVAVTGETPEHTFEQVAESCRFHTSWDWLMPVIEKVGDLRTFGVKEKGTENFMVRFDGGQLFKAKTLIEAAYEAAADYIKNLKDDKGIL